MTQFKWYPDQPVAMLRRLVTDLLAAIWILTWAAFGFLVYQATLALLAISRGITDTGHTFNQWLGAFHSVTPQGIPGISDFLNGATSALESSGNSLITAGGQVHDAVVHLAVVLGLLTALPPILIVLAFYLPGRYREAREMGSALAFVKTAELMGNLDEARALLAYRAVATLSFRDLMHASRDPVGDLSARRYDGLAQLMLARAGLEPRRLPETRPTQLLEEGDQARLGRPRTR